MRKQEQKVCRMQEPPWAGDAFPFSSPRVQVSGLFFPTLSRRAKVRAFRNLSNPTGCVLWSGDITMRILYHGAGNFDSILAFSSVAT